MAHPAYSFRRDICKQRTVTVHTDLRLAIFLYRSLFHPAAKYMHHKLGAIAKSQHRNSQLKKLFRICGGIFLITTVRTTCQNDTPGRHSLNLSNVRLIGINLTIYIALPDTPCHKLVILATKINDNYPLAEKPAFHVHSVSSLVIISLFVHKYMLYGIMKNKFNQQIIR